MKRTNIRIGGGYPLLNNGFAITSMIYLILIMAIILMALSLAILSNRQLILNKQKEIALDNIYSFDGINNDVSSSYKDTSGAVVEIPEGLTPVKYVDNNWKIVNLKDEWYNYNNQEWANAVILDTGVTKNVGDTVNVSSEIKGMFVYVPRYEYKIEGQYGTHTDGTEGTSTSPGEIEVNFISKEIKTSSDEYILHPAFTFGDTELNGIWVGKFETTGTGDIPTILPNSSPLPNQTVSVQFATAQKFNILYLGNNSAVDTHMAKNSEWGAAAYLSQSKYGKYGNKGTEVYINNYFIYDGRNGIKTGCGGESASASTSSICNSYDTEKGQEASTTGNITGIYDMNGGSCEYVMGVFYKYIDRSGFNTLPSEKYYDNYTSEDATTACNNGVCYGHALSETFDWYSDSGIFDSSGRYWFVRGNSSTYGIRSGIFSFESNNGGNGTGFAFRVVITNS